MADRLTAYFDGQQASEREREGERGRERESERESGGVAVPMVPLLVAITMFILCKDS
jgi:hypothetical protein